MPLEFVVSTKFPLIYSCILQIRKCLYVSLDTICLLVLTFYRSNFELVVVENRRCVSDFLNRSNGKLASRNLMITPCDILRVEKASVY